MAMVATSKLRKCRQSLEVNGNYDSSINEIIDDLSNNFQGEKAYIHGNESTTKLYIILTSDKGLCGGFNGGILGAAVEELNKYGDDSLVILVGQKGRSYFNKFKYDTVSEYVEIPDIPSMKEADMIAKQCLAMYDKFEVGEVYVVYSKFISNIKREVDIKKILPLTHSKQLIEQSNILCEPHIENIFDDTIKIYLRQTILNCMLNCKASEQSTRMEAMNGATQNANDMLDKLELQYNRLRQSAITQEISEIVSGAEAQK
jgi:F-type H+-transporting ATPase subunit gamma